MSDGILVFGYRRIPETGRTRDMSDETTADLGVGLEPVFDEYRLRRPGQLDLVFDGQLLAAVSSRQRHPGRPRWTEINLYRTTSARYVTEVTGRTTAPGETDRVTVTVCDTPDAVVAALTHHPRHGPARLTELALEALNVAADYDFALGDVEHERIS